MHEWRGVAPGTVVKQVKQKVSSGKSSFIHVAICATYSLVHHWSIRMTKDLTGLLTESGRTPYLDWFFEINPVGRRRAMIRVPVNIINILHSAMLSHCMASAPAIATRGTGSAITSRNLVVVYYWLLPTWGAAFLVELALWLLKHVTNASTKNSRRGDGGLCIELTCQLCSLRYVY